MGMCDMIKVSRENDSLIVESGYWVLRHNLARGGCVDDIRIRYGSNTNLLADASDTILNGVRESEECQPIVHVEELDGDAVVTMSGRLGGKNGRIQYSHRYHYTPWSIRHSMTIQPDMPLCVKRLVGIKMAFAGGFTHYTWGSADFAKSKPRFMHIVGPHYDDLFGEIPANPVVLHEDLARPWSAALIRRGIEGIQWCGDSHVYQWDELGPRRSFRLSRLSHGVELELNPIADEQGVELAGPITLGWYWILPNIRRLGRKRHYEVAIQTVPFPADGMLDAWKAKGIDVLRIHDDNDKVNGTDDYWHDGRHPPFGPEKMTRLRRLIDAAHRRDMKIIPYFSGHELSPDTSLFAEHAGEWYASSCPNGHKRYTPSSGAGVYGALMCPMSGWGEALEKNIRSAIDELGFDGFYLDWTDPQPCFNTRHLPGPHNGIDGLIRLLERMRRHIPEGIIVSVCAGKTMLAHNINVADQYVTFEEGLRGNEQTPGSLESYPMMIDYMGAGVASAVPNILYGADRSRLYRGLVHVALLGLPPYPYVNVVDQRALGYESWKDEVEDPRGMFGMSSCYAQYDWEQYHFYSALTGVTSVPGPGLAAAVYLGDGKGVLVAGNLRLQPSHESVAQVNLSKTLFGSRSISVAIPPLGGWEFRLISFAY